MCAFRRTVPFLRPPCTAPSILDEPCPACCVTSCCSGLVWQCCGSRPRALWSVGLAGQQHSCCRTEAPCLALHPSTMACGGVPQPGQPSALLSLPWELSCVSGSVTLPRRAAHPLLPVLARQLSASSSWQCVTGTTLCACSLHKAGLA